MVNGSTKYPVRDAKMRVPETSLRGLILFFLFCLGKTSDHRPVPVPVFSVDFRLFKTDLNSTKLNQTFGPSSNLSGLSLIFLSLLTSLSFLPIPTSFHSFKNR